MTTPGGELRRSFDRAAATYHEARPDYPEELFDALVLDVGLTAGTRVLEVGCGTGKATLALARLGARITAIELGEALAAVARRNLAAYPGVEIVVAEFEHWRAPAPFDLVVAATSWHWVDPQQRYQRAAAALRPGGHLAVWKAEHVVPDGGDPFFAELQDVYDEIGEGFPPGAGLPRPGEVADLRHEMEATGLFVAVNVRRFDWEVSYDADGYIALLDTFSGHVTMADWQRDRLYGEIRRRLAARPDGRLRRHWGAALSMARLA